MDGWMDDTLDVILVNRCNKSDEFRTVLPAKICVRMLAIMMLAAAAVFVVCTDVGAAGQGMWMMAAARRQQYDPSAASGGGTRGDARMCRRGGGCGVACVSRRGYADSDGD